VWDAVAKACRAPKDAKECAAIDVKTPALSTTKVCVAAGSDNATCAAIDPSKAVWDAVAKACRAPKDAKECAAIDAKKPVLSTAKVCVATPVDDATCKAADPAKPAWSTGKACVAAAKDDATCKAIDATKPVWATDKCVAAPKNNAECKAADKAKFVYDDVAKACRAPKTDAECKANDAATPVHVDKDNTCSKTGAETVPDNCKAPKRWDATNKRCTRSGCFERFGDAAPKWDGKACVAAGCKAGQTWNWMLDACMECSDTSKATPKYDTTAKKCVACPTAKPKWSGTECVADGCLVKKNQKWDQATNKCVWLTKCAKASEYPKADADPATKFTCTACPAEKKHWADADANWIGTEAECKKPDCSLVKGVWDDAKGCVPCNSAGSKTPDWDADKKACKAHACKDKTPNWIVKTGKCGLECTGNTMPNAGTGKCDACAADKPLAEGGKCYPCPSYMPQWGVNSSIPKTHKSAKEKMCNPCPAGKDKWDAKAKTCGETKEVAAITANTSVKTLIAKLKSDGKVKSVKVSVVKGTSKATKAKVEDTCDTTAEMATDACKAARGAFGWGLCKALLKATASKDFTCSAGGGFDFTVSVTARRGRQLAAVEKTVATDYSVVIADADPAKSKTAADALAKSIKDKKTDIATEAKKSIKAEFTAAKLTTYAEGTVAVEDPKPVEQIVVGVPAVVKPESSASKMATVAGLLFSLALFA
jgi:hypothetical protein